MTADPLAQFLDQARASGKLESTGRFSLNVDRANHLLRDLQLADRSYYLLKLAQAAMVGEATWISYRLSYDRVEIYLGGGDLELFDTSEVLGALTRQEVLLGDSALSHLAVGLNAALATRPTMVEWTVWNAWRQERLRLDTQGTSLERLSQSPWEGGQAGYCLTLHRHPPPPPPPPQEPTLLERLKRWVVGAVRQAIPVSEEHRALSTRLAYCPIRVEVDGRPVNSPELGGDRSLRENFHEHELFLYCGGPNTFAFAPSSGRFEATRRCDRYERVGTSWHQITENEWLRGCLMGAVPSRGGGLARVTFVHFGVSLDPLEVDLRAPGAIVVSSTAGLSTDLSQRSVAQNQAFDEWCEEARQWLWGKASSTFLAGHTRPAPPYVTAGDLPSGDEWSVTFDLHGGPKALLHRSGASISFSPARLKIPEGRYPLSPPQALTPRRWQEWLQGALRCVADGGRVRITQDFLKGPYVEEGDGVLARFENDHL
ncbi:MAG: hypothetical protein KC910_21630, partial [Candidatus Eremiobacteraeota bacterium]|nr:hypothetical protein [Candidatus Eremiobacteraeota bacterium]